MVVVVVMMIVPVGGYQSNASLIQTRNRFLNWHSQLLKAVFYNCGLDKLFINASTACPFSQQHRCDHRARACFVARIIIFPLFFRLGFVRIEGSSSVKGVFLVVLL